MTCVTTKTNQQPVRDMMALGDKIELHTSANFHRLKDQRGQPRFETDKRKLMSALNEMDAGVQLPRG